MGNDTLKVIDVFSGVGGLSYGFAHNSAFEIIAANEIVPNIAVAYSLNNPSVKMYVGDISDFSARQLDIDLGIGTSGIDIMLGGPPCQAYSTVGKRAANDPRGTLFREYYRILKECKPTVFVYENVKGLLSMQGGALFKTIISLFESLGYSVQHALLNAADYGAPQIRERVIIVGSMLKPRFKYPLATHYNPHESASLLHHTLLPYLTLEEAIGDLPFINTDAESHEYATEPQNNFQILMRANAPKKLLEQNAPKHNAKLVKIMELLPDGGTPQDLPISLRPTSGFKNTYCRLWWKRAATTITRNLSTPSSSRCIHPKAPRALTTREGARLQCFPDSYQFYGTRSDKNIQIGNAVPTFLSHALAQAILSTFKRDRM